MAGDAKVLTQAQETRYRSLHARDVQDGIDGLLETGLWATLDTARASEQAQRERADGLFNDCREAARIAREFTLDTQTMGEMATELCRLVRVARERAEKAEARVEAYRSGAVESKAMRAMAILVEQATARAEKAEAEVTRLRVLLDQQRRCECRDDEACAHVQRAEKAEAEAQALKEEYECMRVDGIEQRARVAVLEEALREVRAWRRCGIGLEPMPTTDPETLGVRIDAALREAK